MPVLDVSELNIVLGALGAFMLLYGAVSVKIRQAWYLGIALPSVVLGIALGPVAVKFIDSERWGAGEEGQTHEITLGITRVMIGLQLVMAGYQLPGRFPLLRWRAMALCLLPIMTIMWLCTTLCIIAAVPYLTLLSALVIASCVTCTDPVLSQAIAKGPFADKFVARPLREMISAEAGANDGFGFPFLMLAVYLMRSAGRGDGDGLGSEEGRAGGGVGVALKAWFLETWLYMILLSLVYGVAIGYAVRKGIGFCLRRRWIDNESYLLVPSAIGLLIVGAGGAIGSDDSLACFAAGCALNWDGRYLLETQKRYDEVNTSIQMLLNFGGFFFIGTILPWEVFHDPAGTGLSYGRLFYLGFGVIFLRRIPAVLMTYKLMPEVCRNYKEALFMGYFGPIGAGAVFYVEYAIELFPELGEGDKEEMDLVRTIRPIVYWLVLFSIVFHGLSITVLDALYTYVGVKPIHDDAVEIRCPSRSATPVNGVRNGRDSFIVFNRFSRPVEGELPVIEGGSSAEDPGRDHEKGDKGADVRMEEREIV